MAQGQTGGASSRGPKSDPGGDTEVIGGSAPPYDRAESAEVGDAAAEGTRKAFQADEHGGEPGPPPPVSKEERDAVSPTDTTGATPLGVGESKTEGGEEIGGKEAGRGDSGGQGQTDRPTGVSTGRDTTGVNPSEGQTHESER